MRRSQTYLKPRKLTGINMDVFGVLEYVFIFSAYQHYEFCFGARQNSMTGHAYTSECRAYHARLGGMVSLVDRLKAY